MIDISGVMTVIDISEGIGRPSTGAEGTKLERKDVWAMCWASDNPQLLAVMEKTRMYIFKGIYPEEPVACSGYLCSFNVSFVNKKKFLLKTLFGALGFRNPSCVTR